MMKAQTLEFITGYLFGICERNILKLIDGPTSKQMSGEVSVNVPLCWYGLRPNSSDLEVDKFNTQYSEVAIKLSSTLMDIFTDRIISTTTKRNKQYMEFTTKFSASRRKITIPEIEEILGYKIEIIDN